MDETEYLLRGKNGVILLKEIEELELMAKKTKPKKRKGRSWGIPAAIAIAPGAGTGGAAGGGAGGGK